ncbi:MAG: TIM barrel protein [Nanoarchaeota archaeon]|nr:TIM barrel protein [Nanoarchaeota archaeon]
MTKIRFGTAGIGKISEIEETFENYNKLGIRATEIEFVQGIYLHKQRHKNEIEKIKKLSEKLDIKLSIHAPFWVNLNSNDEEKIEASKKRILDSCEVGEMLGVERVVFHPAFYNGKEKEETYIKVREEILKIMEIINKKGWKVKLAPETTGKVNVFGSVEEILRLVKDTGCEFTLDFSHVFARNNGDITYEEIIKKFKGFKRLHCHFSGIEYSSKGEIRHKNTEESYWEELLGALKNTGQEFVIINEAPEPEKDCVKGIKIWEEIN